MFEMEISFLFSEEHEDVTDFYEQGWLFLQKKFTFDFHYKNRNLELETEKKREMFANLYLKVSIYLNAEKVELE